jgi:hypothetical protein
MSSASDARREQQQRLAAAKSETVIELRNMKTKTKTLIPGLLRQMDAFKIL